ncbi:hypothetical protein TPL01_26520 [Sulfuriferula plumbiphila]|uniref:Uncharacterized protein n=1 Tax=Sulfuriferula plumbiphila TaxID=171865 RepID=A0A512LAK0_9PROT|nr:hypothetical protein SFPGR_08260 [Sulfuriferula plumbiphila]GEP31514.1 hypothetical protein TPL01_26520 [Sulfuriferula plumbiphila]
MSGWGMSGWFNPDSLVHGRQLAQDASCCGAQTLLVRISRSTRSDEAVQQGIQTAALPGLDFQHRQADMPAQLFIKPRNRSWTHQRARSDVTQKVNANEGGTLSIHAILMREMSGQLRFLD